MNWYYFILALWLITACVVCTTAVVASKSRRARIVIVVVFGASLFVAFPAPFGLLSRAKPTSWAWMERDAEEVEIRGIDLREGEGIYMMLIVDGEARLYVLPWDQKLAQNASEAMADAEAKGTVAMLRNPFKNASPFTPISDALRASVEGLFGRGDRNARERQGMQAGGRFTNSKEDRDAPAAYARPQQALPPKRPAPGGVFYQHSDE